MESCGWKSIKEGVISSFRVVELTYLIFTAVLFEQRYQLKYPSLAWQCLLFAIIGYVCCKFTSRRETHTSLPINSCPPSSCLKSTYVYLSVRNDVKFASRQEDGPPCEIGV